MEDKLDKSISILQGAQSDLRAVAHDMDRGLYLMLVGLFAGVVLGIGIGVLIAFA